MSPYCSIKHAIPYCLCSILTNPAFDQTYSNSDCGDAYIAAGAGLLSSPLFSTFSRCLLSLFRLYSLSHSIPRVYIHPIGL